MTSDELRKLGPHFINCRNLVAAGNFDLGLLREAAVLVQTTGRGPGSLEDDETAGLDYEILNRSAVLEQQPSLYAAYCALAPVMGDIVGLPLTASGDEGAINVNIVSGREARYELHLDSQPWTLLVFIGEHGVDFLGGELVVEHPLAGAVWIKPTHGMGVLFDGSRLPHAVRPLRQVPGGPEPVRVTMPCVFVDKAVGDVRDPAMSGYLYDGKATGDGSQQPKLTNMLNQDVS